MKFFRKTISIILILFIAVLPITSNADESKKINILFLGNSLFYTNEMDLNIFPSLCKTAGKNISVTSITESGTTLYRLASKKTSIGKKVLQALTENAYDYVIIQPSRRVTPFEYSVYHAEKQAALYINSLACKAGAKTLICSQPGLNTGIIPVYTMNESGIGSTLTKEVPLDRKTHEEYFKTLTLDFLNDMVNAEIVNIGDASETIMKYFNEKSYNLYKSDNRHPSVLGSMLSANCIYSTMFNESTVGLNYYDTLTERQALLAQRAAAVTVLGENESILTAENCKRKVTSSLINNNTAVLNWNDTKNAEYYRIYRWQTGGKYTYIGRTEGAETTYTDNTLKSGIVYHYKIKAVHKVGDLKFYSDYSDYSAVATLAAPKLTSVKLQNKHTALITFEKVKSAKRYQIYRRDSTSNIYKNIGKTSSNEYKDTTLKQGKTYIYYVAAEKSDSNNYALSNSSNTKKILALAAPTAKRTAKKTSIIIKINKVKYANKYAVYIKKATAKKYKLVSSSAKTTVKIKNLKSKTKYNIRIKAYKDKLSSNTSSIDKIYTIKTK